ncbi:uncharacterized protein LOC117102258 isoform X1 [Anneissia japonica]|uniref:uncharacterized protein LOC117102258 isoform X1 n=1 Tax=Anneissia japonica TaxID=1529436 RepID=UPI001425986F|nr:uncharacterized protein LOC117102258 isoform X1 [Anneissia japonica]
MDDIFTRCVLIFGSYPSLGNDQLTLDYLKENGFFLDKFMPISGSNPMALAILKDQKDFDKLSKKNYADVHFKKFLTIEDEKSDFCAIELSTVITELARSLDSREIKQKLQGSYTCSDGGLLVFGDLSGIMGLISVLTEKVEEYLKAVYNAEFANYDTSINDFISQSVVVTGFPIGTSVDRIKIALQKRKDGGGDVECIHPVGSLTDSAIAVFSERHVVDNLKAKGIMNTLRFPDHKLQIKALTDYGDLDHQYILVRGFKKHDDIDSTKDKLTINLQTQALGGGDVNDVMVGQAGDIALVEFDDNSVSDGLLQKKTITAKDGDVLHFGKSLVKFFSGCVVGKFSESALQVFPEIKNTLNKEEGVKWKCIAPNEYLFYAQDSVQELKDFAAKYINESYEGMQVTYRKSDIRYPPTYEREHIKEMLPQAMITEEPEIGRLPSSDVPMTDESSTLEVCQIDDVAYNLFGETKVIIHHGDITDEDVDVIVNAANCNLEHGGGVALAIAKRAGPELEREGNDIIHRRGYRLQVGEVVETMGYNLKARHVIHAVGPNRQSRYKFRRDLFNTFCNCLEHASKLNAKSIALPLISAGLYGGDLQECAEELANALIALRNGYTKGKQVGLKEIRIVDKNIYVALTIQDAFTVFTSEKARQTESFATEEDMECIQGEVEGERATSVCKPSAASQEVKFTDVENTKCCHCKRPHKKFILDCNHVVCNTCLSTIRKNAGSKKCPQCKHRISDRLLKHFENDDTSSSRLRSSLEEGERDSTEQEKDICVICLDDLSDDFKELKCKHKFCKDCIDQAFKVKPVCPSCGMICGEMKGNQPPGTMNTSERTWDLPDYAGCGTIEINYQISSGIQTVCQVFIF